MTRINSLNFQFDWRWAAGLAALVLSIWLIRLLGPVLTPFVAGALIAYLGDPLVRRLGRRMPRSVATSLVFVVMTLFMVVLVLVLAPMLEQQLAALIRGLPQALSWLEAQLAALQARVGWTGEALSLEAARDWLQQNWGSAGQLLSARLLHDHHRLELVHFVSCDNQGVRRGAACARLEVLRCLHSG